MRILSRHLISILLGTVLIVLNTGICSGQLTKGQDAPIFSSRDSRDKIYDLSLMKQNSMVILYFFDVDSYSSQEGLLFLDKLGKQYAHSDLIVWAITISEKGNVGASTPIKRTSAAQILIAAWFPEKTATKSFATRHILQLMPIAGWLPILMRRQEPGTKGLFCRNASSISQGI